MILSPVDSKRVSPHKHSNDNPSIKHFITIQDVCWHAGNTTGMDFRHKNIKKSLYKRIPDMALFSSFSLFYIAIIVHLPTFRNTV